MDDDDNDEPNNVFRFGAIQGGRSTNDEGEEIVAKFPEDDYCIYDIEGGYWDAHGFLIFTSHHVAIMKPTEPGRAVPALVIPMHRVKAALLIEDDEE